MIAEAVLQTLHVPSNGLEFFVAESTLLPESEAGGAYLDMLRWTKRSVW